MVQAKKKAAAPRKAAAKKAPEKKLKPRSGRIVQAGQNQIKIGNPKKNQPFKAPWQKRF